MTQQKIKLNDSMYQDINQVHRTVCKAIFTRICSTWYNLIANFTLSYSYKKKTLLILVLVFKRIL